MSVNIRFPNITALSEREQLAQIKSYLHQLVEQLNYALPNLGTGNGTEQTVSVQGGELSYYELRTLIIQQIQHLETMFNQLSAKMESEYIKDTELEGAINQALEQAKESGEFDGPPGEPGQGGVGIDSAAITEEGMVITYSDGSTTNLGKLEITMDEEGNLYYEIVEGGTTNNDETEDENTNNEVEE